MPKLHEKADGDWYIRVYRGENKETGQLFIGTWQLHASGLDVLRQYRIFHDGDVVPMVLFKELLASRKIWSETGRLPGIETQPEAAPATCRVPPPRRSPISQRSVSVLEPNSGRSIQVPKIMGVPLDLKVHRDRSAWQVHIAFDQRRPHAYDPSWLNSIQDQNPRLHIGEILPGIDIGGPDGYKKLRRVSVKVIPSLVPLPLTVRTSGSQGQQTWSVGSLQPVGRHGTLFDPDGMRLTSTTPIRTDNWYYTLLSTGGMPSPSPMRTDCQIREYPAVYSWTLVGFKVSRFTSEVRQYLWRLGFRVS